MLVDDVTSTVRQSLFCGAMTSRRALANFSTSLASTKGFLTPERVRRRNSSVASPQSFSSQPRRTCARESAAPRTCGASLPPRRRMRSSECAARGHFRGDTCRGTAAW